MNYTPALLEYPTTGPFHVVTIHAPHYVKSKQRAHRSTSCALAIFARMPETGALRISNFSVKPTPGLGRLPTNGRRLDGHVAEAQDKIRSGPSEVVMQSAVHQLRTKHRPSVPSVYAFQR